MDIQALDELLRKYMIQEFYMPVNRRTYNKLKKQAARARALRRGYKSRGRKNITHKFGGR